MPFKPSVPFNVPMKILIPKWEKVNGVRKKVYPLPEDVPENLIFYGSFRTFGGTETENNGVYGIENTATIETWYRPEITAECQVHLLNVGKTYEVLGEPENIEMRNQYLKVKVRLIGGKA